MNSFSLKSIIYFNSHFLSKRVGRTARAGREGTAISLITQVDVKEYQKIEECIKKKNELFQVDENEVLQYANRVEEANKEAIFVSLILLKRCSKCSNI